MLDASWLQPRSRKLMTALDHFSTTRIEMWLQDRRNDGEKSAERVFGLFSGQFWGRLAPSRVRQDVLDIVGGKGLL